MPTCTNEHEIVPLCDTPHPETPQKLTRLSLVPYLLLSLALVALVLLLAWICTQLMQTVHTAGHMGACPLRMSQSDRATSGKYNTVSRTWLMPGCQTFYTCDATTLVLDRTCTREDMLQTHLAPRPHAANIMISHKYRAVYVMNPTDVQEIVAWVFQNYTGAVVTTSEAITPQMIEDFFFFSFTQDPYKRFMYTAEKLMQLGTNTTKSDHQCTSWNTWYHSLASPLSAAPSQAYVLSTGAGHTHKMIHLDWLADSANIKGALIEVMHACVLIYFAYQCFNFFVAGVASYTEQVKVVSTTHRFPPTELRLYSTHNEFRCTFPVHNGHPKRTHNKRVCPGHALLPPP